MFGDKLALVSMEVESSHLLIMRQMFDLLQCIGQA